MSRTYSGPVLRRMLADRASRAERAHKEIRRLRRVLSSIEREVNAGLKDSDVGVNLRLKMCVLGHVHRGIGMKYDFGPRGGH